MLLKGAAREINAVVAIADREVMRIKNLGSMIQNIIFPMIILGIMGGSLTQNLVGNIGYNYLQFIMIGMIVFNMFAGPISGMTSMITERDKNLTQELYVSPISRYTIILGKMIGSSIGSMVSLIGILIVAELMQIPFGGIQIVRMFLIIPVICLVGASLGIFFIGFVQDPKVAQMGVILIAAPQMFLSGAIIPISHSTGILGFMAKLMPMTYAIDLARGVFYWGDPVYSLAVLHHPLFNATVMAVFFLIFSIIGTIMFTSSERNR